MSEILIIGDAHGRVADYLALVAGFKTEDKRVVKSEEPPLPQNGQITSIQLGDFGFGFVDPPKQFPAGAWFIRGNHDDPAKAKKSLAYLADWGYLDKEKIFFISGAYSIDKAMRILGKSWWEDEELSWRELSDVIDSYEAIKPDIVVSHEAPASASLALLQQMSIKSAGRDYKIPCAYSRTGAAMEQMLEIHQPDKWIFGHYHYDLQFQIRRDSGQRIRTEFTCLAELSTMKLQIPDDEEKA